MKRVAIVTGTARGIGAAIAARLEAEGFVVARLNRSPASGEIRFDLGDLATHQPAIDAVLHDHGRIDALVNNAGIASPKRGDFMALETDTFDTVMNTNLRGTVFFTQAVARAMLTHVSPQRRSIQFITSVSSTVASPERLDYCMSKAGLGMFARGLALRLASEGIDVFEVRPGIIKTDMTAGVTAKYDDLISKGLVPEGRWGMPDDIAAVCAALASGSLPLSTGSVIDAGGGLHIPKL
jgi:3-oxoacyl-[acyl-carrier protein] reductase